MFCVLVKVMVEHIQSLTKLLKMQITVAHSTILILVNCEGFVLVMQILLQWHALNYKFAK